MSVLDCWICVRLLEATLTRTAYLSPSTLRTQQKCSNIYLITVSDLLKGSVPETILKPEIFRIDPIPFIYHASSVMNTLILSVYVFKRGRAVAQVVDALRYKPEGRGFDSPWCN